jgi:hypothetical protein
MGTIWPLTTAVSLLQRAGGGGAPMGDTLKQAAIEEGRGPRSRRYQARLASAKSRATVGRRVDEAAAGGGRNGRAGRRSSSTQPEFTPCPKPPSRDAPTPEPARR